MSFRSLAKNKSNQPSSPTSLHRLNDKAAQTLTIANNFDYEAIESLPEIISQPLKIPPALPPKPQFRNTLILKTIPSPSFLIDETSQKKQNPTKSIVFGIGNALAGSVRSLKFDDASPKKSNRDDTGTSSSSSSSFWKNRFNNVRSSFQLRQTGSGNEPPAVASAAPERPRLPKVTNIVRHFEEFKIDNAVVEAKKPPSSQQSQQQPQPVDQAELDEYDIQQNFEEFNLDDCDLSDDPDRLEADGSETYASLGLAGLPTNDDDSSKSHDNNNSPSASPQPQQQASNGNLQQGNYDSFLEATGLSNKSILTPSRLLSNHKSMLKPKDVKYKSKIKATAVLERHGGAAALATTTHTKHWTGPFV